MNGLIKKLKSSLEHFEEDKVKEVIAEGLKSNQTLIK